MAADQPAVYPNRFQRDGGLVVLPSQGTLYIASDFHTRYTDFKRWLAATQLVEKLKAGEDVYGLILGDAADVKPGDAEAEPEGDSRIIDHIRQLQESLGDRAHRVIFILGNHEAANIEIYALLKEHFSLNAQNRRRLINLLYNSEDGAYYRQFNFLERISDEQFEYLKKLPVAVLSKSGLLAVHAAPSKSAVAVTDLVKKRPKVLEELLWSRPAEIQAKEPNYTAADLLAFLRIVQNSSLLITGHTPLGHLPESWIRNGLGVYADRQIILGTSYGALPNQKSHLVFDLAKSWRMPLDLAPGQQILPLYPAATSQPAAQAPMAEECVACMSYPRHI
ncbi:MAG TPA: metallophosphoesterase [Tepidisphaeraceae bacterium]|nr:metallophosphoesterase [Tepidisphaeraceae bacterium]